MQQNGEVRRDEEFDCKGQDHVVMVRSAMRSMLAEYMGSNTMDRSRNQNMALV